MNKTTIPATQNEGYGFWGTTHLEGEGIAQQAWPLAMTSIAEATGEDRDSVRAFLDSKWGRHFADDVHNFLFAGQDLVTAIKSATARWMNWKLNRATRRDFGIPMSFNGADLTAFVITAASEAETSETI